MATREVFRSISVLPNLFLTKSSGSRMFGTLNQNNLRNLSSFNKPSSASTSLVNSSLLGMRNYGSIYEPEYLDANTPEVPTYDLLNIQMKGYDFPVLEKYSRYVHHTAERMGIAVEEAWPQPAKKLRVTKLKPESNVLESEYFLKLYERNVQISEVPATLLPVLVNVVEAALPAGVTLRVHPHIPEHFENRYVPDLELKQLRAELDEMGGSREKK